MQAVRRAVIDVGTNSIKLLVAEVAGREVRPVCEQSKQTRLGQGFYQTHRLRPEAIAATAQAVTAFAEIAREHRATSVRIIATSAARDAANAGDLASAVEAASGLRLRIISGEQEADWVFQGVTTDPALRRQSLLLLDVGGGSTEFIVGRGDHKHFSRSFPLGTVRLMEIIPHSDPPATGELAACQKWIRGFLEREVRPEVALALQREAADGPKTPWHPIPNPGRLPARKARTPPRAQLVGTGGTTSILARMEARLTDYDRERMEATRLSLDRLRWHLSRLWSLPLEKRKQIVGLPANRADVILTGAVIYEAVMELFGFEVLRISTRGLRFAAVMEGG